MAPARVIIVAAMTLFALAACGPGNTPSNVVGVAPSDSPSPSPSGSPSPSPAPLEVVPPATGTPTVAPPPKTTAAAPKTTKPTVPKTTKAAPPPAVYYKNCDDVRAHGAAPLYRGQPGYRAGLDRDGDGVACEN
jgi:hypothetical protein